MSTDDAANTTPEPPVDNSAEPANPTPEPANSRSTATAPLPAAASDSASAPASRQATISKSRRIWVNVLIGFTTLLAVVGMLSIWANRLLFNPDNWENTSTQLLQNPQIRSATSNYLVDQLYANVNVPGLIQSGLPQQLQPLAGPAAGALQNVAVQGVDLALSRPLVQTLWAKANRAADQTFIAIVNGGKGPVKVNNGVVTLNLGMIVQQVAARFGIPTSVASKLPPNVAQLTVLKSNQLGWVQKGGKAIQGLALWLSILVPLLYAAAIALTPGRRRRTLMTVGFAIVLAGLIGFGARALIESQITNALATDASVRPAVHAVVAIGTQLLGEVAGAFILVGAVLVVAAWFAGPAREAVAMRRTLAPGLREHPGIAFAVTAAIMILVFIIDPIPATGTPVGIIVFMLLALLGTEVLRRQTAVEFPDARTGDTRSAVRTRMEDIQRRRQAHSRSGAPTPATLSDQLEQLAKLRDDGAISAEDYDAAKAKLLRA